MADLEFIPPLKRFLKMAVSSDFTMVATSIGIALLPTLLTFILISLPLYFLFSGFFRIVQKYEKS